MNQYLFSAMQSLFAGATGNCALPRWPGDRRMDLFFTPKSETRRCARQVRNAAGIAVFVAEAGPARPLSMPRPVQAVID